MSKSSYKKQMAAWNARVASITKHNRDGADAQGRCIDSPSTFACGYSPLALPDAPNIRPAGDPGDPATPAVTLPPETLAYLAVARLHLIPPTPVIGPDPDANRWHLAAVGYPLWLAARGDLHPAPVADQVYGASVSLRARLSRVVFDMGDGRKVSCTRLTHPWTASVTPGTASPYCGYRYREPSLPKGRYTVTANTVWAVDWTVNGASGTLPFYESASTTLPVGELQVLVR